MRPDQKRSAFLQRITMMERFPHEFGEADQEWRESTDVRVAIGEIPAEAIPARDEGDLSVLPVPAPATAGSSSSSSTTTVVRSTSPGLEASAPAGDAQLSEEELAKLRDTLDKESKPK